VVARKKVAYVRSIAARGLRAATSPNVVSMIAAVAKNRMAPSR
jgi:hypothetical protein